MSTANDQTSSEFAHYLFGHSSKSPYFVKKEVDKRLLYATKIMPFVTFTDYSKLEQDATVKQTELEILMMKDARKDRDIEELKEKLQVKNRELELLKQRDMSNSDRLSNLETILKDSEKRAHDLREYASEQVRGLRDFMECIMKKMGLQKDFMEWNERMDKEGLA
jgi:hypothetical protein